MRLFVAIELPEAWRVEATAARRWLLDRLLHPSGEAVDDQPGLRFTSPERLHLTLRFLGEVDEAALPALQQQLAGEVVAVDVALELAALGTFGSRARPRVVWLGLGGDLDGLQATRAAVDRALVAAGVAVDDQPLRPHITLARVDRRATPGQRRAIRAAIEEIEAPASARFVAREVVLVRSHLGRDVRYEVLGRYPRASI